MEGQTTALVKIGQNCSALLSHMLRDIAGINIRGGDVVEVSPAYDTTGATAVAGAHVATEILQLIGTRLRAEQCSV